MKIAVPTTKADTVDAHFGHCEFYTIFTVNNSKEVTNKEILPSSQGCGCKSNIASVLKEKGVNVMLAGNMGGGALNVLTNHGIDVYRGCTGDVCQLTESFLLGKIGDSGIGCHHHEEHGEGHVCNH